MPEQLSSQVYDAVIVGAGHSGLYLLHKLRGLGFNAIVLEAEDDVGGTWYRNRYPGLRCDVESVLYSYSFDETLDQEWEWSERFPAQPEILSYLHHVADRFDLRKDILLNQKVTGATWDQSLFRWTVATASGRTLQGRFCLMATGILSVPSLPSPELLGDFAGEWYHTANWPKVPVSFAGKRVGVIGTGSSAVQVIPRLAEQAEHLYVFQRTPAFAIPAQNYALDAEYQAWWRTNFRDIREKNRWAQIVGFGDTRMDDSYRVPPVASALDATREEREARYQTFWDMGGGQITLAYPDLIVNEESNRTLADFTAAKIDEIVADPVTADALKPRGFPLGTKRPCLEIGYYEAFNRDNVNLIDVRKDPIGRTAAEGIVTASGATYDLDAIVFATGYDAVTGALLRMDVRGVDGLSLAEKWADGPVAYLGLMTEGFPNLFLVLGPTSPSAFTNCVSSIEQHVDWIADLLVDMRERGDATVEATAEAEEAWSEHAASLVQMTLFPKASSWYMGDNIPGKPRRMLIYIGGMAAYRTKCDDVARSGYVGLARSKESESAPVVRS
ncbi:flavin-containing monooxygenase [Novosphingobium aquimarinum]|uniref:flavin-containing monooxygenase n=1 Tax=Novosphingobium aquimarinum TaxID=2682494 RepID=UPI0012ECAD41|nr:NAD(P)/FAD-dependent oxidoreductase [Novosphingobium aquimarinum]